MTKPNVEYSMRVLSITTSYCKGMTVIKDNRTGKCGYHVPGSTRLGKMSKPLLPSRLRFWQPGSGSSGDCRVWKLATDPSPVHSADGSSAADISPGRFSAAGLWKAPLDGRLTRVPRERWQLLALRSHLHLSLPLPPVNGLLSSSVLYHTPPL